MRANMDDLRALLYDDEGKTQGGNPTFGDNRYATSFNTRLPDTSFGSVAFSFPHEYLSPSFGAQTQPAVMPYVSVTPNAGHIYYPAAELNYTTPIQPRGPFCGVNPISRLPTISSSQIFGNPPSSSPAQAQLPNMASAAESSSPRQNPNMSTPTPLTPARAPPNTLPNVEMTTPLPSFGQSRPSNLMDTAPPIDDSSSYGGDDLWQNGQALDAMEAGGEEASEAMESTEEPIATPAMLAAMQVADNKDPSGEVLVSVDAVAVEYRKLFTFPKFNRVQSRVFDAAYNTSENLVVSAPTSSGKTTVFELAFLQMLRDTEGIHPPAIAIYIAPTKALCSERSGDWVERLAKIQTERPVKCIEVTGDTSKVWFPGQLSDVDLIVTTPEKWDAVTRAGSGFRSALDRIRLVMIDEVHILCEPRGPTLEVVVSRMRTWNQDIRFVAVSASVPNIDDVARWLGPPPKIEETSTGVYEGGGKNGQDVEYDYSRKIVRDMPKAKVFRFGEEYRPTKLKREIYGYEGGNEWALNARFDQELYSVILKHSERKPTLVFCPTRKSCHTTATYVLKQFQQAKTVRARPWDHTHDAQHVRLSDERLRELAESGIAIHHAGLELKDRRTIEEGFRDGRLQLLICTSTLAVGVNLPAHTVIIKGTTTWSGLKTGFREYSDIDIQQMMGRAGRPQYDQSGTVIVMCQRSKVMKYRNMLNNATLLESYLHNSLVEHLNSEIALQTIRDLRSAQEWIKSTFLYVRIQQKPQHYASKVSKNQSGNSSWDEFLDHYVEDALNKLHKHELCTSDPGETEEECTARNNLAVTQAGRTMSMNCISYGTMCSIQDINAGYDFRALFEVLCGATEFTDLRIRQGEHQLLNAIRTTCRLRYPLDNSVKTYADKVYILLQTCFGNVDIAKEASRTENASITLTQGAIFQSAGRIAKAISSVCQQKGLGRTSLDALELVRVVHGRAWEDDVAIFRQLDNIGPKSMMKLKMNGVTTFEDLLKIPPTQLEIWMNRITPFGRDLLNQVMELPRYRVDVNELNLDMNTESYPRALLAVNIVSLSDFLESKGRRTRRKEGRTFYTLSVLCLRSDGQLVSTRRVSTSALRKKGNDTFNLEIIFTEPSQIITFYVGVDEMAGLQTATEWDPKLPKEAFEGIVQEPEVPEVEANESVPAAHRATFETITRNQGEGTHQAPSRCDIPEEGHTRYTVDTGQSAREHSPPIQPSRPTEAAEPLFIEIDDNSSPLPSLHDVLCGDPQKEKMKKTQQVASSSRVPNDGQSPSKSRDSQKPPASTVSENKRKAKKHQRNLKSQKKQRGRSKSIYVDDEAAEGSESEEEEEDPEEFADFIDDVGDDAEQVRGTSARAAPTIHSISQRRRASIPRKSVNQRYSYSPTVSSKQDQLEASPSIGRSTSPLTANQGVASPVPLIRKDSIRNNTPVLKTVAEMTNEEVDEEFAKYLLE